MAFYDRKEAGEKLGNLLAREYGGKQVVVYGLPRGGVVTAKEVAKKLHAPLLIVFARKIGHPMEPEYAIAAISEHGHLISNPQEIHSIDEAWLSQETAKQKKEIEQRKTLYHIKSPRSLQGKIVIIVDDGIATGLTTRAAIADMKDLQPDKIVVAVPAAPQDVIAELRKEVDDVIVLEPPGLFLGSVGAYYEDFPQVTDEEVVNMLRQ